MPDPPVNPRKPSLSEGDRFYPLSCGSQGCDWQDRNCYRCAKFDPSKRPASKCEIIVALAAAQCEGDGSVSGETARRMGYLDSDDAYTWDCPEREFPQTKGGDDAVEQV